MQGSTFRLVAIEGGQARQENAPVTDDGDDERAILCELLADMSRHLGRLESLARPSRVRPLLAQWVDYLQRRLRRGRRDAQ